DPVRPVQLHVARQAILDPALALRELAHPVPLRGTPHPPLYPGAARLASLPTRTRRSTWRPEAGPPLAPVRHLVPLARAQRERDPPELRGRGRRDRGPRRRRLLRAH